MWPWGRSAAVGESSPDVTDGSDGSDAVDLVGRTFIGDDVKVNKEPYHLAKNSTLRISFDEGSVGASAGCNSMSGSATWDDGVLVVDQETLSMTEMGCQADLMDQDLWLAEFLTSKPRLTESADTLTMASGDTVIVLVDEEAAVPDLDVTGTKWQLDSITAGGAVSSVPSGVSSTIEFDDNGFVSTFLGCNWGRGSYGVRDDVLTIEPLATTRKACPPPGSDVESEILSFLQGELEYSIDGESLVLTRQQVVGSGPDSLVYRTS